MSQIGSDLLAAGWHPKRDAVIDHARCRLIKKGGNRFSILAILAISAVLAIHHHAQYVLSSVLYWNRLRDVLALDLGIGFHVGNRPRDLQYPVVPAQSSRCSLRVIAGVTTTLRIPIGW